MRIIAVLGPVELIYNFDGRISTNFIDCFDVHKVAVVNLHIRSSINFVKTNFDDWHWKWQNVYLIAIEYFQNLPKTQLNHGFLRVGSKTSVIIASSSEDSWSTSFDETRGRSWRLSSAKASFWGHFRRQYRRIKLFRGSCTTFRRGLRKSWSVTSSQYSLSQSNSKSSKAVQGQWWQNQGWRCSSGQKGSCCHGPNDKSQEKIVA